MTENYVNIMADLQICRVCFATGVKLHSLYNYNLKTAFENLTGINITVTESYPNYLCSYCQCLVIKSNIFKERCVQSQELLKCAPMLTNGHIQNLFLHSPTHSLSLSPIDTTTTLLQETDIKQEEDLKIETQDSDEEPLSKKVKNKTSFEFKNKEKIKSKKNYSNKKVKNKKDEFDFEFGIETSSQSIDNTEFNDNEKEVLNFDDEVFESMDFETDIIDSIDRNIEIINVSKEEQIEEVLARKNSLNYHNSFYKCDLCFKGFITDVTYKNHMARHDPYSGDHQCDICKTRWPDVRSLKAHKTSSHERKYICKLCNQTSKSYHRAKEHLRWHKGHTFVCKICGASFTKSTSHLTHVRLQHPSKYCCNYCGESFIGQTGLNMHKKKAHKGIEELNPEYLCTGCNINFRTLEALKQHTSYSKEGICDNNICPCIQCGEHFLNAELLKDHQKTHQKEEPVKCDECNRTFAHERSFATHYQRVHLGIKLRTKAQIKGRQVPAVVCEICGKKCISNATLVYHQRIHTGEKPFQCIQCPKRFSVYQRLQIHIRTHTGERPFKCSHCPKAFKHKAALNRHDRVHSGAKPYQCSHCAKSFSQSNSMKLHIKTVHLKMPAPYRNRRNNKHNDIVS